MTIEVLVGGRRPALPVATARRIVRAVMAGERRSGTISLTFLGRESMKRLNREYHGSDQVTDVLAFTLSGRDGSLLGDVYICRHAARRTAESLGIPLRQELIRLVIHGTLHVLGYDHPEGEGRTASPMWRRQESYVRKLT